MHLMPKQTMCIYFAVIFTTFFPVVLPEQNVASFLKDNSVRIRRQGPVVQPDWVPNSDFHLFEDFNVRVTDRKLDETEAIRDFIQETVENGTYEVELDEGDFEEGELEADEEGEESPPLDLSEVEGGPELKVDPRTMTVPEPEPEPAPIPVAPKTKISPSSEPQHPRIPASEPEADVPNKSKSFTKTFRGPSDGGSRLVIWLRKAFNRS